MLGRWADPVRPGGAMRPTRRTRRNFEFELRLPLPRSRSQMSQMPSRPACVLCRGLGRAASVLYCGLPPTLQRRLLMAMTSCRMLWPARPRPPPAACCHATGAPPSPSPPPYVISKIEDVGPVSPRLVCVCMRTSAAV
jgi:hypothetical protein